MSSEALNFLGFAGARTPYSGGSYSVLPQQGSQKYKAPAPTSSGSGSGGSGEDAFAKAQAKADAKEKAAKKAASDRNIKQAQILGKQADALKIVLHGGFKKALERRLANISTVLAQQDASLLQGYRDRTATLDGASEDNEAAASDQTYANLANRGRERSNALSEAMLQGAGESDVLRAQQMSLRSWNANQSDINRAYFDTLRSINSSQTDLNTDTRTARVNMASQANADRELLYNDYYSQMSEAYTQYGNIRGQQAEYYGLANEQVKSSSSKKNQDSAASQMENAFKQASNMASKSWTNPGVSPSLMKWEGEPERVGRNNTNRFSNNAQVAVPGKAPEGATLRSW